MPEALFETGLWAADAARAARDLPAAPRAPFADDLDAPPAPPPDTVPRAALEQAIARARLDGRREGEAAAASSTAEAVALTLGRIAADLPALSKAATAAVHEAAEDVARLLVTALGRALPGLAASRTEAAVLEAAEAVRPALAQGGAVARVHPLLADMVARCVARAHLTLRVIGDDAVAQGDAVLSWDGGSARREASAIWEAIRTSLEHTGFLADGRSDVHEQ